MATVRRSSILDADSDTLPFALLAEETSICGDTLFVDVDYEKLIKQKCDVVRLTSQICDLIREEPIGSDSSRIIFHSKPYVAAACDLHDVKGLDEIIDELNLRQKSVLFIAEVSLTYMDVGAADALIRAASTLRYSKFCLLEQWMPQGPEHPFTSTMLEHFNNLHSPLKAPTKYQTPRSLRQRFFDLGWRNVDLKSLWDIWKSDSFISTSEKRDIDRIEPFDEWEEFALFSSHYFLLVADSQTRANTSIETENLKFKTSQCIKATFAPYRSVDELHRYSAVFRNSKDDIVCHGGYGSRSRLNQSFLYSIEKETELREKNQKDNEPSLLPGEERVCHTICKIGNSDILIIGGRTSPAKAIKSCLWRRDGIWLEAPELPRGRFRHCSVRIGLPHSNSEAVLVYGGKTDSGEILNEWLLWSPGSPKWENLEASSESPCRRFGASMSKSYLGNNKGHLTGGLDSQGNVIQDLWEWQVFISSDGVPYVNCRNRTPTMQQCSLGRFGASMSELGQSLYLVGGVGTAGVIPREETVLRIDEQGKIDGYSLKLTGPDPILIGHSLESIGDGSKALSLAILGGGALCFSFGTFWNKGAYTLQITESALKVQPWKILPADNGEKDLTASKVPTISFNATSGDMNNSAAHSASEIPTESSILAYDRSETARDVERLQIGGQVERFKALLNEGLPVVLGSLDFGRCTDAWDADYLMTMIGKSRAVIVHSSPSTHMDFLKKNFKYETMEFEKFIAAACAEGKVYLRSVSSEKPTGKPTNLEDDFPAISADFSLPRELEYARTNAHSSPLRITGRVHMWLHYDALPNVYCQIRGRKRIALFHPSTVTALRFPHGASSSSTIIFDEHGNVRPEILPLRPYVCSLDSGEALLIPAMWPHAAAAVEGLSVAVNTFFRDLSPGTYAAGKDIYGNRDIQAYESGRRDLEKIQKSFRGLPQHIAQFYLRRLATELGEAAAAAGP